MYGTTSSTPDCTPRTLERPRYFPRQLVTPAELNLESRYFVDRMRRHNRMLHGWGVVCGALVCRVPTSDGTSAQPWKVAIRRGFLIDGHGNEVEIVHERIVDLRSSAVTVGCGEPPGEVDDPWCSDVPVEREPGRLWLAVCYRECLVRPVRTEPSGCGCDDTTCEYSRWQDGYEVHFLSECPETHQGPPPDPQAFLDSLKGPLRRCPECPEDPCVVLAAIEFDDDGTITAIDNCSCRRMVVSVADFWWRCAGDRVLITSVSVTGKAPVVPGAKELKVVVKGENLSVDAAAELGEGISAAPTTASSTGRSLNLQVDIDEDAVPGERALTITGPDCSITTFADALTIEAPPAVER
jgi:hypothetical protein